jgi:hypothetical protein
VRNSGSSSRDDTVAADAPARVRDHDRVDQRTLFHSWLAPALVFVGLLAVQLAWIASLPTFRGIDEHDHVYRADSVAAGDWVSSGETTDQSRGELVSVRRSIVDAAGPVCDSLPYTERYDCHAYASDGQDRVLVASAAARYNPAFYWAIGMAAKPFEGTDAVYAMRLATATICALLVALAFSVLQRMTGSPWRLGALLVVLTPTMTYSTAIAAPNGVEMSAALLTWASLLALAKHSETSEPLPAWLAVTAASGLCVLTTVRSLGPLWAMLIVAAILALGPGRRLRSMARRAPRPVAAIGVAWLVALAVGAAWTLLAGTNDPRSEGIELDGSAWSGLPKQFVLWVFQSIGAFPTRGEQAPVVVYALVLVASTALLWLGYRSAVPRRRLAMLGILVAVLVVSAAITVATYPVAGFAWQGRYIWPVSMGVPLLAGLAITTRSGRRTWLLLLTACVAGATAISQVAVFHKEVEDARTPHDWTFLPAPALVGLTVAGFALVFLADLYAQSVNEKHQTNDLA